MSRVSQRKPWPCTRSAMSNVFGPDHLSVADTQETNRMHEEPGEASRGLRCTASRGRHVWLTFGPGHQDVTKCLSKTDFQSVLYDGSCAGQHFERSPDTKQEANLPAALTMLPDVLATFEKTFGPEHLDMAKFYHK